MMIIIIIMNIFTSTHKAISRKRRKRRKEGETQTTYKECRRERRDEENAMNCRIDFFFVYLVY